MLAPALLSPSLLTFTAASLILALIPGPAVIYLTTQTLARGRRAGLASVAGVALGNLMNAAVACCGLAAVLAASAAAFTVVKFAGAAYLIYLGLKALGTRAVARAQVAPTEVAPRAFFRDAVIVAFLNPKTALFFAALLPQFVDPHAGSTLVQNFTLAGIFVGIALCTDTLYVMTAAGLRATLQRSSLGRWGRYLSAGTFIGLGVYAALASPRSR